MVLKHPPTLLESRDNIADKTTLRARQNKIPLLSLDGPTNVDAIGLHGNEAAIEG